MPSRKILNMSKLCRRVVVPCYLVCIMFAKADEPTGPSIPSDETIPPLRMVSLTQISEPENEQPMAPAAVQFVKGMALVLLPETYSDDDDWGGTKKVQSGLNVEFRGLKLDTSRRWKEVNHGTWRRIDATLVDPKQHFDLAISLLPQLERGVPRYRVRAKLRLRATGRQQHHSLGARLLSISADFVADIAFDVDLQFKTQVVKTDGDSKLRMIPFIERANARLESLSLRRISNTKGGAVREFGKTIESIARRAIRKKNEKLAAKINRKINKKPERFEIPAGILAVFGEQPDESTIKSSEADKPSSGS